MHSPFVYTFTDKWLKALPPDRKSWDAIELLRKKCFSDSSTIEVEDYGAGRNKKRIRKVKEMLSSSTRRNKGRLLSRLVMYLQPKKILELGTHFGFGSAYLLSGSENAILTTIEGCRNTAERAKKHFEFLKIESRLTQKVGEFQHTLSLVLEKDGPFDMVYVDGHHLMAPTLSYFNTILQFSREDTCIIFDDIHWSKDMHRAWEEIIRHEAVTVSMDFFSIGVVILRKGQRKQHFVLKSS